MKVELEIQFQVLGLTEDQAEDILAALLDSAAEIEAYHFVEVRKDHLDDLYELPHIEEEKGEENV